MIFEVHESCGLLWGGGNPSCGSWYWYTNCVDYCLVWDSWLLFGTWIFDLAKILIHDLHFIHIHVLMAHLIQVSFHPYSIHGFLDFTKALTSHGLIVLLMCQDSYKWSRSIDSISLYIWSRHYIGSLASMSFTYLNLF